MCLKVIKNKDVNNIVVELYSPELTFLGMSGQPYRGKIWVQYVGRKLVIDTISFKKYLSSYISRELLVEEAAINISKDIKKILKHKRVKVTIDLTARGGIQSRLIVDSNNKTKFPSISNKKLIKQM